jgi:hypothetical protein
MSAMRRTIAIALAVALLMTGGCGRQDRRGQRPPAAVPTASVPPVATDPTAPTAGAAGAAAGNGSVDELLDQVEQQLSGDAQPADDED